MKTRVVLFLLCLCLLLAACGRQPAAPAISQASPPVSASSQAPASSAPAPQVEIASGPEDLTALLDRFREDVTIGTAGSSLRAVAAAADLLDWAAACSLSPEEIATAYEDWYPHQNPDRPAAFEEQLSAVDYAVQLLLHGGEEAVSLLNDAGYEDCGYPWDEHAASVADALMQAAGLR